MHRASSQDELVWAAVLLYRAYMLYESLVEIVKARSASIVFQRWLRKFGFQHLIFLIFLRFGAGFWNILKFSFWSFFKLGIFKIYLLTLQNHFWNPPGSILKPFEKNHFSSFQWIFSHSCRYLESTISLTSRLLPDLIFCMRESFLGLFDMAHSYQKMNGHEYSHLWKFFAKNIHILQPRHSQNHVAGVLL